MAAAFTLPREQRLGSIEENRGVGGGVEPGDQRPPLLAGNEGQGCPGWEAIPPGKPRLGIVARRGGEQVCRNGGPPPGRPPNRRRPPARLPRQADSVNPGPEEPSNLAPLQSLGTEGLFSSNRKELGEAVSHQLSAKTNCSGPTGRVWRWVRRWGGVRRCWKLGQGRDRTTGC